MVSSSDFWKRVNVGEEGICWEWSGARDRFGYGIICPKTWGTSKAHRYAFMASSGKDPARLNVCHSCDNPSCCNPLHLWLGTQAANIADAMRKGRITLPVLPIEMAARGSSNGNAKANKSIAIQVASSKGSAGYLAKQYGISAKIIRDIRSGKSWSHVTGLRPVIASRES